MARRKKTPEGGDFSQFLAQMQMIAPQIQMAANEHIRKGWKQIPNSDASRSPKSWVTDPLSLQYSLGYKDRKFSLTYDTLKRMSQQLSLVQAIINLRCSQVAAFCEPFRKTRNLGFVVKHKDADHATTPAEIEFIKELESFIINCGRAEPNPYSTSERDDFETLLRKIVRDSLTYDQVSLEVIPDQMGIPYEFMAVDASTIRFASDDRLIGVNSSYHSREGFVPGMPSRFSALFDERTYGGIAGKPISFVQVVNGQIENVYTRDEMIFGVRNPRTDLYCFPRDTRVLLSDYSEIAISDVKIGDSVITHTGKNGDVYELHKRYYDGELVEITTRSKRDVKQSTPNHPFLAAQKTELRHFKGDKEACLKWVPAGELKRGEYLAVPKLRPEIRTWTIDLAAYSDESGIICDDTTVRTRKISYQKEGLAVRAAELSRVSEHASVSVEQLKRYLYAPNDYCAETQGRIQTSLSELEVDFSAFEATLPRWLEVDEEVAYALGLWVAEGSISSGRFVNYAFHRDEENLVQIVRNFAQKIGVNYTEGFSKESDGRYITLHSRILAEVFGSLFGLGAQNKKVPRDVFHCPPSVKTAFLEGYFLGDGSHQCHKGVPTIAVGSVSRTLVHHLELLLNTLGYFVYGKLTVPARTRVIKGKESDISDVYGFTLAGTPALKFDKVNGTFNHLLESRATKSRGLHYLESENYFYVKISSVSRKQYSGDVFNFGVRGDNSYVTRYAVHNCNGYGMSELEQCITIITSHLNAERYNSAFFTTGSQPRGLLNLKGDNYTQEQLESFKRQWAAMVQGVENAWKTPVLQSEGLEWVDLNKNNRDMEFGQWLEYLTKVLTSVYLVDPSELNMPTQGGVSQTPLFESSSEWKLKASRDRGLKPLLKFIAKLINKYIIDKIDDHFTFEFVGLDELSEQEKHEMVMEQISSYKTLNEVRRQQDLPELPGGDMPMNPVYLQALELQQNMQMQAEQQAMMQQQQQMGLQAPPMDPEKPQGLPGADPDMQDPGPQYTDNFKKMGPEQ